MAWWRYSVYRPRRQRCLTPTWGLSLLLVMCMVPLQILPVFSQPGGLPSPDGPELPRIRSASGTGTSFDPSSGDSSANSGLVSTGVSQLRVVKGRSQLLKFAQAIQRVSIADPAMADVIPLSPQEIMVNGRQRGVTTLAVWDERGREGLFDLYVDNDSSEVLRAVKAVAPGEAIEAKVTDDSFVLMGRVSNSVILEEIRKIAAAYGYRDDKFLDLTETPVPQVLLKVRIAEATRSTIRDLQNNAEWTRRDFIGKSLGSAITGAATITNASTTNQGGLLTFLSLKNFMWALDYLETKGAVNILAEPSLVCTHGREASFLAGGEFPFITGVSQNGQAQIQFKEYGVKLKFTPWIAIRTGRIELKVEPEVSKLDTGNCVTISGLRVCALLKRTTSTTVEMGNNQTLVISGILSREEENSFQNIPGLGSIPILNHLNGRERTNKQDKELIVIITPELIPPNQLADKAGDPAPLSLRGTLHGAAPP
jgi:pilus assembly protein CpaC